jgi:hypothetical protein
MCPSWANPILLLTHAVRFGSASPTALNYSSFGIVQTHSHRFLLLLCIPFLSLLCHSSVTIGNPGCRLFRGFSDGSELYNAQPGVGRELE